VQQHTANNEAVIKSAGHKQLTGADMRALLQGKTLSGLYRGGFHFITTMDDDLRMEGRNHVGSHNFGVCEFDDEAHTMTVTWENGWDHTTTRAYHVGDEVRFFDVHDGSWRQTLTSFQDGRQSLKVFR